MTTHAFNLTKRTRIFLLVLLTCSFTLTSRAQTPDQSESHLTLVQHALLDAALDESYTDDVDATRMSAADWKTFARDQVRSLASPDRAAQQAAMKQIIFHATFHGDVVSFRKAAAGLYAIYRFDREERFRIMALAALHAIGYEETMRYLAQDVQWEKSPRVRRLTQAALADHYAEQVP